MQNHLQVEESERRIDIKIGEKSQRTFRMLKRQRFRDNTLAASLISHDIELIKLGMFEEGMTKRTKLELLKTVAESRHSAAIGDIMRNQSALQQPKADSNNVKITGSVSSASVNSSNCRIDENDWESSPDLFSNSSTVKENTPVNGDSCEFSRCDSGHSSSEQLVTNEEPNGVCKSISVPQGESKGGDNKTIQRCGRLETESLVSSNKLFAPNGNSVKQYAKVIEAALDSFYDKLYISQRQLLTFADWGPAITASKERNKNGSDNARGRRTYGQSDRNVTFSEVSKVTESESRSCDSIDEVNHIFDVCNSKRPIADKHLAEDVKKEACTNDILTKSKSSTTASVCVKTSPSFYGRGTGSLSNRTRSAESHPYMASKRNSKQFSPKSVIQLSDDEAFADRGTRLQKQNRKREQLITDLDGEDMDLPFAVVNKMPDFKQEKATKSKESTIQSNIMCPLCSRFFEKSVIEQHASDCNGVADDDSCAAETADTCGHCNVCDGDFPADVLDEHVLGCLGRYEKDDNTELPAQSGPESKQHTVNDAADLSEASSSSESFNGMTHTSGAYRYESEMFPPLRRGNDNTLPVVQLARINPCVKSATKKIIKSNK